MFAWLHSCMLVPVLSASPRTSLDRMNINEAFHAFPASEKTAKAISKTKLKPSWLHDVAGPRASKAHPEIVVPSSQVASSQLMLQL